MHLLYYARAFLRFTDFKEAAHLTVYILAMYLLVITCTLYIVQCTWVVPKVLHIDY